LIFAKNNEITGAPEMNKLLVMILCIGSPLLLVAQNSRPITDDIQVEVMTTELNKSINSQNILIRLTCNTSVQSLLSGMRNVKSSLIPVSASRGTENLWLIKSNTAHDSSQVMAWNADADNSQLALYPGNWNPPYEIELNLRASFPNLGIIQNLKQIEFVVQVRMGNTLFEATPTGAGNIITLK
jgi:hypothetical protein